MKKKVAVILAVLMVSLTGCSGGETKTNTTVAESSSEKPQSSKDGEEKSGGIGDYTATWNIATNVVSDSVNGIMIRKFQELVEEKSGGAIKVKLYEQGTLGNDAEIHEGVASGSIDMISSMTSGLYNVVPEAAVFDMPSVFPSVETARKVLNGDFGKLFASYTEKYGVHVLGYSDMGYRQTATGFEVGNLEDLKGLKIRTMDNKYHLNYWTGLGAAPTPMDWNEVYTGLQQKTVDAVESPYEFLYTNNFYEVCPYITNTNHLMHIITFLMNQDLYEGLPDAVKILTDECAAEAVDYANQQSTERMGTMIDNLESNGCTIIDLDQASLDAMSEKSAPIYDAIREEVGDELVDGLLDAVKAVN